MSKTKGGGSTRNGRDSNAQRLGVKVFDGTAITAVGSALGHVRLAPERRGSRPTVSGRDVQAALVDEGGHRISG